jgi:hypothetical protein
MNDTLPSNWNMACTLIRQPPSAYYIMLPKYSTELQNLLSITVGARCCEITFSPNQRFRDRRADGAMGYGFALRFQCTSACQQRDVAMDSFKQIGSFIALVHTLSCCLG